MKWSDVQYRREDFESPAIERFTRCVRQTHVNGGIVIARFVAIDADVFDRAALDDLQGLDHLFTTFLNSPSVREAVGELTIHYTVLGELELRYTVPLGMEGELTH